MEHNDTWTVEVSRRGDVLGLVVCGPTDLQHGWMRVLHPGQEATTPTAALVLSDGGWQGAAVEFTAYRRALCERIISSASLARRVSCHVLGCMAPIRRTSISDSKSSASSRAGPAGHVFGSPGS